MSPRPRGGPRERRARWAAGGFTEGVLLVRGDGTAGRWRGIAGAADATLAGRGAPTASGAAWNHGGQCGQPGADGPRRVPGRAGPKRDPA
jgi:hypothetical protein